MYRTGKLAARNDYRTLRFSDYVTATLPPPPVSFNVFDRVAANLKQSDPAKLYPLDGNDRYGDCTCAALAHAETVWNGMLGKSKIMAASDVTKLYFKLSGGADSGLNELDVLNFWRKSGAGGEKISAFVKVNPHNHVHVQQAMALFGGLYIGFQCQEDVIKDFDAHKPWTPGKLTQDGHAVFAGAFDQTDVAVLTWGAIQQGTWGWWDETVDEAWCILSAEALQPGFAPGFNSTQLLADLKAVAA